MKSLFSFALSLIVVSSIVSCSDERENEIISTNLKSVSVCEVEFSPGLLVSWCMDGTDFASPNETINFAAALYSVNDNPSETSFSWKVESGNMEVISVENSIDGNIARSIATIQFKENFIGNGLLLVQANNISGSGGFAKHEINLE